MHIVNNAFLQSTPFRFFGSILWIFPGEKIGNLFPLGGLAFTLRKKGLLIGTIFRHTHIELQNTNAPLDNKFSKNSNHFLLPVPFLFSLARMRI